MVVFSLFKSTFFSLSKSMIECLNSLKTMASDKTPGTDGLPAEFYKVFWEDIEGYLLNALNGVACVAGAWK